MSYTDSPNRPRLHFWFGPLSMMDFLGKRQRQLAARDLLRSAVLAAQGRHELGPRRHAEQPPQRLRGDGDVRGRRTTTARASPIGQNYQALKNALFYPKSLLHRDQRRQHDRPSSAVRHRLQLRRQRDEIPTPTAAPTRTPGWRTRSTCSRPSTLTAAAGLRDDQGPRGARQDRHLRDGRCAEHLPRARVGDADDEPDREGVQHLLRRARPGRAGTSATGMRRRRARP